MVLASWPVASLIRFAARPVGAAKRNLTLALAKILRMALMMVVLPAPGPPVITTTLLVRAHFTASTCFEARVISSWCCTQEIALSGLMGLMALGAVIRVLNRAAILVSLSQMEFGQVY